MQQIKFIDKDKNRSEFFATLRNRVDQHFRSNNISKNFNSKMVVKTVLLLTAYILPFTLILFLNYPPIINYTLWFIMGFSKAGIGMSVMHDANHGAYSGNSKTNYWIGVSINLVGGSIFNWKLQHNILHHTYTNIVDMDEDIEDKLFFRFSPHSKPKWFHRFQFIYVFFFYAILTLYWALIKDFVQFRKYIKSGINKDSDSTNQKNFTKLIIAKILYFFVFIILPIFILQLPALNYILGFLLMHFMAGIILSVIFQLAHTVENTTHPLPDKEGTIINTWAIHQLNTTSNFSRKSKILTWYLGGLNYQVEHHLFPNICHIHYPAIAPIVKNTAEEFGIRYLENDSFLKAFNSHMRLLKTFGK
ncbi:MAG: acyl-CoA desaturase [Sphingobacteriaceae bacterium]|nr:acyl-CoA desaturase [Sphingobacteriaceae bacterium]